MRFAVVALTAVTLLAACGGSQSTVSTAPAPTDTGNTTPSTAAEAPPKDVVSDYLHAVQGDGPEQIAKAQAFVAPNSPVSLYVQHLVDREEAARQAGRSQPQSETITKVANAWEVCYQAPAFGPPASGFCQSYSDFRLDANGRIVDHKVGDLLVSQKVARGGPPVVAQGATFRLTSAMQSSGSTDGVQPRSLSVNIEIINGPRPIDVGLNTAKHIAANGRQAAATNAFGSFDLVPGARVMTTVVFDGAPRDGQVRISVWDGSYNDSVVVLSLAA